MRFLKSWSSIIFAALLFGALFHYTDRAEAQTPGVTGQIQLPTGQVFEGEMVGLMLDAGAVDHALAQQALNILACIVSALDEEVETDWVWTDCEREGAPYLEQLMIRHEALNDAIRRLSERVRS